MCWPWTDSFFSLFPFFILILFVCLTHFHGPKIYVLYRKVSKENETHRRKEKERIQYVSVLLQISATSFWYVHNQVKSAKAIFVYVFVHFLFRFFYIIFLLNFFLSSFWGHLNVNWKWNFGNERRYAWWRIQLKCRTFWIYLIFFFNRIEFISHNGDFEAD